MPNLTALASELKLEKIGFLCNGTILLARCINLIEIILLILTLVGDMKVHFFLALASLVVLFFKVDLLVKDLIGETNDAPPEDVGSHFIKLLGKFIEYC